MQNPYFHKVSIGRQYQGMPIKLHLLKRVGSEQAGI